MEEEGAETPKLGKEQEEERLEHVGMEKHKRVKRTLEYEQPKRKTPLKLLYKEKDCQPTALQHLEEGLTHWMKQNLHSRGQQLLQMIVMERKELAEPLISTDAVECAVIALELKQAEEVECRADLRQMKPELVPEKRAVLQDCTFARVPDKMNDFLPSKWSPCCNQQEKAGLIP